MSAGKSKGAAPRRVWILGLLMALCFISHFNRASITSAGDERIMQQFGISPDRMGVIYSSFLVVYTLFMIPGGWFIDRKGPRVALACMGLGSALFCGITGMVGFGFVPDAQVWMALLCVRASMGMLSAPLHPGAARAVGNWFSGSGTNLANGLITGASILAYAVVHPVFGALIDRINWPQSFLVLAMMTALLAGIWWSVARDHPFEAPQSAPCDPIQGSHGGESADVERWSRRSLVWITLSYAGVGYFQYLFFYWLHYYFDSILHMEKSASRWYAGLPSLAMAVCMPLGGWLSDALSRRWGSAGLAMVPKWGMAASALLLLLGIQAKEVFWIVASFTTSLGVLGLCESSFWTVAVRLGGARGGTSAAIMNTGGNGIGLLAPMLTPFVSKHLGWEWGLGLGAAVGLLGAACWAGIKPVPATPER